MTKKRIRLEDGDTLEVLWKGQRVILYTQLKDAYGVGPLMGVEVHTLADVLLNAQVMLTRNKSIEVVIPCEGYVPPTWDVGTLAVAQSLQNVLDRRSKLN